MANRGKLLVEVLEDKFKKMNKNEKAEICLSKRDMSLIVASLKLVNSYDSILDEVLGVMYDGK